MKKIIATILLAIILLILLVNENIKKNSNTSPIEFKTSFDSFPNTSSANLVDPSDLISGGPPKDGIPSIDNPSFVGIDETAWLLDDSEVFILVLNETARIYPQPIMVWHEIVNDEFEGIPVAITYCPLCGSTVAYKRVINGETVEFGTTGLLYNSNLVMYDRLTDSYWTQIRGEAVIGKLTGMKLEKLPLQTMKWAHAKKRFPQAQILSKETGFSRSYGSDPYIDYYEREEILFPVKNTQSEYDIGSKTIVIGLTINGESRAYTEFDLITQKNITDELGGQIINLVKEEDGFMTITNLETGEEIAWEREFWFAWLAFHPETTFYSK